MNDRLEAALQYAARGWPVFILSGYKTPFKGTHGHKDATTDRAMIEGWFRDRKWANVGLACGEIVVFDADGPGGLEQFRALGLPRTLTARTSRGFHFFYNAPAGVKLRSHTQGRQEKGGDGLDIKAHGGYVVLPPSVNKKTGFVYQWVLDAPMAELSAEGLAYVESRRKRVVPSIGTPSPAKGEVTPWGAAPPAYLADLPGRSIAAIEHEAEVRAELPRFVHCLSLISAECEMDEWFGLGGAIYDFDPGPIGFAIFKRWSLTSTKPKHRYEIEQEDICERTWARYENPPQDKKLKKKASIYVVGVEADKAKALKSQETNSFAAETKIVEKANGSHSPLSIFTDAPQAERIEFVDFDKDGNPRGTLINTAAAISRLGLVCRHDVFHDKMTIGGQPIAQWAGDLNDNAALMLRVLIKREFGFDPGKDNAHDGAVQLALQNSFDPVCDYLDGLAWDGCARIGQWLASYMGAEETALNQEIGRLVLLAAVRRARRPGAKFDQIMVLEGPEGQGKSSAVELLAGTDNFSDQKLLTLDERGQQEAVQGVWLYELGDLAGHGKAEVESVKTFASRTYDRARPAYGRMRVDRPRRCVFIATTNNDTYLKSQTGNRRFWPVRTSNIRLDDLARDRDQLWAEAGAIERGASLVLPAPLWGAAGALQDERRDHDPWEDMLAHVKGKEVEGTHGFEARISSRDLLDVWLKLPADRQTDGAAKRLSYTMRRLGWDGTKVFKVDGIVVRGYTRALN